MLPRQPSKVPRTEPTICPSTSARRTLALLSETARRRSSALSVTLGVASAWRHNSRTNSTSSGRQSRMETLTKSLIAATTESEKPAAAIFCHGPPVLTNETRLAGAEFALRHGRIVADQFCTARLYRVAPLVKAP